MLSFVFSWDYEKTWWLTCEQGSTGNNSPAPSVAESVMDSSYYGIFHGLNSAVAMNTRGLLVQSYSRT